MIRAGANRRNQSLRKRWLATDSERYASGMKPRDIARARLLNQHIIGPGFETPADAVRHLGAVQSQDYPGAKWAVGQRVRGATDASIEEAFAAGRILRTHVLRPTWHFVTPEDIRWMLALTAPRIKAAIASRHRQLGLDEAIRKRSNSAIAKALEGGEMTRPELGAMLRRKRVVSESGDPQQVPHLLAWAELDAVICSGPRRGLQHTYALLDERAPPARALPRDEALAELTRRYFTSHGPATMKDFAWWSGLTIADGRAGIAMMKRDLESETIDGRTYWFGSNFGAPAALRTTVRLLPNFDEYVVGYSDRSAIFDPAHAVGLKARNNPLFNYIIVVNGEVVGWWTRAVEKDTLAVTPHLFRELTVAENGALSAELKRFGKFLGRTVTLA